MFIRYSVVKVKISGYVIVIVIFIVYVWNIIVIGMDIVSIGRYIYIIVLRVGIYIVL